MFWLLLSIIMLRQCVLSWWNFTSCILSESQEIHFPSLTDQFFGLTEDFGECFFPNYKWWECYVVLGEMSCQKVHFQLLLISPNFSVLPGLDMASAWHYHIISPPSYWGPLPSHWGSILWKLPLLCSPWHMQRKMPTTELVHGGTLDVPGGTALLTDCQANLGSSTFHKITP